MYIVGGIGEMLNDEVLQMSRILTVISFSEKGGRLK